MDGTTNEFESAANAGMSVFPDSLPPPPPEGPERAPMTSTLPSPPTAQFPSLPTPDSAGAMAARRNVMGDKYRDYERGTKIFSRNLAEDADRVQQKYDATTGFANDPALKAWDAKKKQAEYTVEPLQAFGSFAMIASLGAAAFTRSPMTASLNAAAGVVNSMVERNDIAYKREFDAWKENADVAIKRHNIVRGEFSDALSLMKTNTEAGKLQLENIINKYDMKMQREMMNAGLDEQVMKFADSYVKSVDGMGTAYDNALLRRTIVDAETMDDRSRADRGLPPMTAAERLEFRRDLVENKTPEGRFIRDSLRKFREERPDAGADEMADYLQQLRYRGIGGTDGHLWRAAREAFPDDPKMQAAFVAQQKSASRSQTGDAQLWSRAVELFPEDRQAQADWVAGQKLKTKPTSQAGDVPLWARAEQLFPGDPQAQANWVAEQKKAAKHEPNVTNADQLWQNAKDLFPDDPERQAAWVQEKLMSGRVNQYSPLTMNKADIIAKAKKEFMDKNGGREPTSAELKQITDNAIRPPMTPASRDRLAGFITHAQKSEQLIDDIELMLVKYNALTGIGGKLKAPMEVVGNWLARVPATDRAMFEQKINILREWAPRLINEQSARPLSQQENRVASIVPGLGIQDTFFNTYDRLRNLKVLVKELRGEWSKRYTGDWEPPVPGAPASSGGAKRELWRTAPQE